MTRFEFIRILEEVAEKLLTEVDLELHDKAREDAYCCIAGAIDHLKENDIDERG